MPHGAIHTLAMARVGRRHCPLMNTVATQNIRDYEYSACSFRQIPYTPPMPVSFKHKTLSNGLVIIAEEDPEAYSAACGFFVRTGARDEDPAVMGVSHYLEHMMFKGTDDLPADELNRRFDEIGAKNNAYTSGELTCFYAHILPEFLPEAVGLLGRMMRPALRVDDFDREKQVILEEIAMYKDEPFWVLYEEVTQRHYAAHGLGHRVLGTNETVSALTRDQMMSYFDDRYSADNTIVALAGKLDFEETVSQIESLCGSWGSTEPQRDSRRPSVGAGKFDKFDEKVNRAYIVGMADAPAIDDDRRYAAALLAQILGASDNSRLHWSLIETGIAEDAQAAYDPHDGTGQFFIYAQCDPARLDEVQGAITEQIRGLADSVTEDDLERLRSKYATGVTVGGERPADRMQRVGRLWTYLHRHYPLEDELDRINKVRLEDLRELCDAFPLEPSTLGILKPASA